MGFDVDFMEGFFPDGKKSDFELEVYSAAATDIYHLLYFFTRFDERIKTFFCKLFGEMGEGEYISKGELTPLEIKEFLEVMKSVTSKPNFKVELTKQISINPSLPGDGRLWYDYVKNKKRYHVGEAYDHNEINSKGGYKYEYSLHKFDHVLFLLDFLRLLSENNCGLRTSSSC